MKRFANLVVLTGVLLAVAVTVPFLLPKRVHMDVRGVKFRLGEAGFEQPVHVRIDGSVTRSGLGRRTFKGIVSWDDHPVPEANRHLELRLKDNAAFLIYVDFNGEHYPVGYMAFDRDYSRVAIALSEERENGVKGWASEDGLVLAAPAENRNEALDWSAALLGVDPGPAGNGGARAPGTARNDPADEAAGPGTADPDGAVTGEGGTEPPEKGLIFAK